MKNLFTLLFLFSIIALSCTKEYENPTPVVVEETGGTGGTGGGGGGGGGGGSGISPVPSTFTQKALIEEFTGSWCGYCPDGAYILEGLEAANPDIMIGASIHQGDPLEIPLYLALEIFAPPPPDGMFFPSGLVNRIPFGTEPLMDRGAWGSAANMQISNTASCGLAMTSYIQNNNVYATVHCGFNTTLSGDYRVTIYLIEDKVTGFPQVNYYDADQSSPFFGLGDPIVDFEHNHVVRAVLTADMGDPIPASDMVDGGEYEITKSASVDQYNINNLAIIAFINLVGTDSYSHQVMNVQKAALYEIKDWD